MNKLQPGDIAPDFAVIDVNGNTIRLNDYKGSRVLITFYRFVACPFCSIHFSLMSQNIKHYEKRGLKMISIFESDADYIREYMTNREKQSPIVADPNALIYAQYAVEKSMKGVMKSMFKKLPALIKFIFSSKYHFGKPDGSLSRIPADFIIDEHGYILDAHYGEDASDNIPISQIEKRLLDIKRPANKHNLHKIKERPALDFVL